MTYEVTQGEFFISTDRNKLCLDTLHHILSKTYWAENIPKTTVEKSVKNSLCFGLYHKDRLVGFARLVTDYATFAYLADVFIVEAYRGQGLSKWLMQVIMSHPEVPGLRRIMLVTRDAQTLYSQFDFGALSFPERVMEITKPNIYKQASEL